jgi:tellurite resistance protein
MGDNETIRRARVLLEQKMANESSPLARLRGLTRGVSSADAFFSGLIEGAFLLAAADGEMSEDEEATLGETLVKVTGDAFEPSEFIAMITAFDEALQQDGFVGRLNALTASLPDAAARREVLAFAVLIALCDRHLADAEWKALQQMGDVFGLDAATLEGIVAEARKGLD